MYFSSIFRRTLLAILLSALAAAPAIAGEKLRVAVERGYKPFAYHDEQGRLRGFDVDLAQALCVHIRQECTITPMIFEDILPAVARGEIDFAAVGFTDTPEREQIVLFTDRYFRSRSIFIEKPGTVQGLAPENLKGKRVGVQPGTMQEKYLQDVYGPAIMLVNREKFEGLFKALHEGACDIILVDGLAGYDALKGPLGTELETVGDPIPGDAISATAHMAVSKKQPQLREELNEAIKALVHNGQYAKINRQYFEFDVY